MLALKHIGLLLAVVSSLLLAISFLRDILIPFFLAISIAYLLQPAVNYFEKKGLSRGLAIIILYAGLFIALTFFFFGIAPILYKQINNLIIELPMLFADLDKSITGVYTYFDNNDGLPTAIKEFISEGIVKTETKLINSVKGLLDFTLSALAYLPILLLTPFLTFYFLCDSKDIALGFIRLFPEKHHKNITSFIYDLNTTLMHYIRGQITVAFLVGMLVGTALLIIKIPLAVFLGVFAGVAEVIPFLGPFISGFVIIIFALTVSTKKAAVAFSILIIIQQIEANILTPKILGDSIGLHPLTIIFLILLGGKYFGIVGMFFIVPIFAVVKIFIAHALPFLRTLESN